VKLVWEETKNLNCMTSMTSIRQLSSELATKAEVELNERPEHIASDLEAIRQWLAKSAHITARTDDQFLMIFLRGCKHSLERVKEKLDMFYTVRTGLPEFIRDRDIREPVTAQMLKAGWVDSNCSYIRYFFLSHSFPLSVSQFRLMKHNSLTALRFSSFGPAASTLASTR
jgi:hypothetical protein